MAFFTNLSVPFLPSGRFQIDQTVQWAHESFDIVPVVVQTKTDTTTGVQAVLSIKRFDGSVYVLTSPTVLKTSVVPYAVSFKHPISFFGSSPAVEPWDVFNIFNPSTSQLQVVFSGAFSSSISVDPESVYNLPLGQGFGQNFTVTSSSPSDIITVQLSRLGRA